MWSISYVYTSFDSQKATEYFNKFKISIFFNFESSKKTQNFINLLISICVGWSIKEWVCSVSRDKDGDTRIWVPGLSFSSSIARKSWNCILIDYVSSHQGRAAIHRPECSLRAVECIFMHNIDLFIQVAQSFHCHIMTASAFQRCCLPLWRNTWHATQRKVKKWHKVTQIYGTIFSSIYNQNSHTFVLR